MRHFKTFILAFIILLMIDKAKAAVSLLPDTLLNGLIKQNNTNKANAPMDKLYLQLDRTTYATGDTLWFRAYLFDAAFLRKSAKSNVVYVELSDENNVVQVRGQLLMSNGLGHGCIPLTKRDFPDGGYTIRAYTQWMRNFDESCVFKKQIFVGLPGSDKWLIHIRTAVRDKIAQLHLQLLNKNQQPVTAQQVSLGVRQDETLLRRDKPQVTDNNGGLDLAVRVKSDNKAPVYATLHKGSYDDVNNPVYKFPVTYNLLQDVDLQFMPEGGYLVGGIVSVIGFKAVGEDGKGVHIAGSIINSATNKQVVTFNSSHLGMGSLAFTPQQGIIYKAVVNLPDGSKKEYPLPVVNPAGTALSVNNNLGNDSLIIRVSASAGINGKYYLLGRSRGMVCFAASIFVNGNSQTFNVPKNAFASGVATFDLLNTQLTTLNKRLVYINHHDELAITVRSDQAAYAPQDSIALHLEVKDQQGKPVQGAFSLSVVNSQTDITNAGNPSLVSNMLLITDLKGYVEQPDYYFTGDHEAELDNLLLTQGWTAYDWTGLFHPAKQPAFIAEQGIVTSGKVTNLTGNGADGAKLTLLSINPFFSLDTAADDKGNFTFLNVPPTDSLMYITAKNKKGKNAAYNIELTRPEWPVFSPNRLQIPWYVNTDTTRLKTNDTLLRREAATLSSSGKMLAEVTIRDKKIITGSHNLNGAGNADQTIDEHDIAKEKPMTLLELLKKKVDGFQTTNIGIKTRYFVGAEELYSQNIFIRSKGRLVLKTVGGFIIDGIEVRKFFNNPADIYNLLNSYTSDDIKGIEVMSKAYTSNYELSFLRNGLFAGGGLIVFPQPFIEITTKTGGGPFFKKEPNYLRMKPILSVMQKSFYRPRYVVKNATLAAYDNRATIHWEPNIITDKDGKATVSFYAGGQPATYTITTEGSNMDGSIGSSVNKITIKAAAP